MRTFLGGLVIASAPFGLAHAAELTPLQAHSIDLNGVNGVAYYTVEAGEYRVVAVLSSGATEAPVRFGTTLAADQRIVITVPGAPGTAEMAFETVRRGDTVLASPLEIALN